MNILEIIALVPMGLVSLFTHLARTWTVQLFWLAISVAFLIIQVVALIIWLTLGRP